MEREIIKLPRELIAPILYPDIFEEEEYDKYFKIDADPDLSKEEWNIWNNFCSFWYRCNFLFSFYYD